MIWLLKFHYRKKFTAICRAIYRNELYTGLLNSGYFLEPVTRNNCRVALKVCDKRLATWTLDRHH